MSQTEESTFEGTSRFRKRDFQNEVTRSSVKAIQDFLRTWKTSNEGAWYSVIR